MAELFIELFSEEIPSKLQTDAREKIKLMLEESLQKKIIKYNLSQSFSTPKRLVFLIDGISEKIEQKEKILKGPKVGTHEAALEGFIKSNNLNKSSIYRKKIEKGEFYFAKIKPKTINVLEELKLIIPDILKSHSWKKSMKWSVYELNWGRPLKSIVALFNHKIINFDFFHLKSSDLISVDEANDKKTKKIKDFKSYLSFLESNKIILDQEKRKKIIVKKFASICKSKNFKNKFNEKLIEEVVNLVEKPNVIVGKFDEIFLKIPQEILIITMQQHQKFFPLFEENDKLTNLFLIVANLSDDKGYVKSGNQRVIEARLSDASFFWEKNKKQNLVKQVTKLKNLTFFGKLGSFYDKTQRLRKLASLVSDNLNVNKEKVEIAASLCKVDLISDLVGEYPELQGVMGKYFAQAQGFDPDVSIAISEHYLPLGINSFVPRKPISYSVALADKIDTLVGFFGINEKPTSSKDPFALRRYAIGLLRIIIENNLKIKIKDLINYSNILYKEQNFELSNAETSKEILIFLRDRLKNLLKERKIRNDIIESAVSLHTGDEFLSLYKKCVIMNKNFSKDLVKNIISTYKRVSNIIDQEIDNKNEKIIGQPDAVLFKKNEEKFLFEKINEIRKHFTASRKEESYDETLKILAETKPITENFFNNVIVNDKNLEIKRNRLELLQMFCKTYDNFLDFSKIEGA